jgi:cation transport ATPase
MNKVDIPKTQSVMAVIFTPITGAIAIAIVSFNYITSISHWILGSLAFLGALLGVEAVGGACCYALIKCHREKNYGGDFVIALAGTVAYIAGGVLTLYLQSPIVIFFALSPFGYFAYSIIRTMADEINDKTQETEAQIKLLNAQKNLINAQNRRDKARSTPLVQNVQNGDLNDVNAKRQAEKSANLETVLEYLKRNPEASLSAIGEHIGKGKGTAKNYTDELIQAGRLHKNGAGWEVQ